MAKKKKMDVVTNLEDYAKDSTIHGTPSMVLLPARNFSFKVSEKEYKITIPRSGKYVDVDPDFFTEKDGEFMLLDDNSEVMYLPAISKVLFATKKYPDLKSNQLFAPIALVFEKDTIEIIGQIVEMLIPASEEPK